MGSAFGFRCAALAMIPSIGAMGAVTPRRKQTRRTDLKDLKTILRLSFEQGLSVRAVAERLKLSKTTVSTICCGRGRPALRVGRYRPATRATRRWSVRSSAVWVARLRIWSGRTGRA
jgi:hypothetical protein